MQLKKELRSRGFCEPSKDRVIVSAHVRGRSVAGSAHRIEGDVREEKISQAKCCEPRNILYGCCEKIRDASCPLIR